MEGCISHDQPCLCGPGMRDRLCCTNWATVGRSLSLTDLSRDLCDRGGEGGEAVQDGNANLKLCDLTAEFARGRRGRRNLTHCILVSARLRR